MKRKTGLVKEIRERTGVSNMKKKEEVSTGKLQANNQVIAYYNGKAIIEDDFENLYYLVIEEEFVVLGEIVPTKDLTPISDLPEEEQKEIQNMILGE